MKEKFSKIKDWLKDNAYAYKGIAIGVGCVLAIAIYLIVHYATLVSPDYVVIVALKDESMIVAQQVALKEQLEKYGEDLNGDGDVVVEMLYSALYTDPSNANAYSSEYARISAEMTSDAWSIIVYDELAYEHLSEQTALLDKGVYQNDDNTFSSWNWNGSEFERYVNAVSAIDAKLYFDVRAPQSYDSKKDKQAIEKRIEEGTALLEKIKNVK